MLRLKIILLLTFTVITLFACLRYYKGILSYLEKINPPAAIKNQFVTELVKPAERHPDRFATARCNDGTPFAFKVEKPLNTTSDTWVIYLQGGAYCDDNSFLCKDRTADLITTLPGRDGTISAIIANEGIFNHDPTLNPNFYNANKVYAHYCSSDVWTGASTELRPTTGSPNGWYFSGKSNIDAMITLLQEEYGLNDQNLESKVLFTGSSAGCFGVDANAENVAVNLPVTATGRRLLLVSDSCYVPEFDYAEYRLGGSSDSMAGALKTAYSFWGSSINTSCETDQLANGQDPAECFLGATLYPYIVSCDEKGLCLPNLVQYSSIDYWAITNHGISPKPSPQNVGLQLWQENTLQEIEILKPQWIFSGGGEAYHTLLTEDAMWSYTSPDGITFGDVVNNFYEGNTPQQIIFGTIQK